MMGFVCALQLSAAASPQVVGISQRKIGDRSGRTVAKFREETPMQACRVRGIFAPIGAKLWE